ncbi:MAG: hypothetical protein PHY47_10820 [Lachnospiraceae bacterium]|nr:hypothetical protein [Lachnospiraceae bacterium]
MSTLLKFKKELNYMKQVVSEKYGEGIFLILSISSFSLVSFALLFGLIRKLWLIAWIFVILGALLSVFPIMNLLSNNRKSKDLDSDSILQSQGKNISPTILRNQMDEATRLALELEAALLKKKIVENEKALKEAELKAQEERNAESLKRAFEKHQKEVAEKKRLKQLKEKREFQQRNFDQNYFRKENVKKYSYISKANQSTSEFFKGINNITELKKRYLDLMKIYHPDNSSGDINVTQKIQQEYEKLLVQFKFHNH